MKFAIFGESGKLVGEYKTVAQLAKAVRLVRLANGNYPHFGAILAYKRLFTWEEFDTFQNAMCRTKTHHYKEPIDATKVW